MAMWIRRYGAECIAQYGRSPSGEYLPCITPVDAMVVDFWSKKSSCGVVKSLFEASVQKARNGPSTHVIKATSCVERSNATIKAEEHS